MGIQGLLPLLKSIMNPLHVKKFDGCFVAVDTYSWLHKGALSCSEDLCKGHPTSKHINYCMHRVNMLRHYGVKPILIFDGGLLPMKSEQESKRTRSRKENLTRAAEHELNGNRSAAYECYQKAVDISPSIAYELIQVLKLEDVPYIVAPYEADAQMTFLALNRHVEAVITEDSDLIAFGCPRILYKMDKFGQGVEFKSAMLQNNKELNLAGFTQMMLLEMCILSGCDYLQSLPGMGLKKAHALIKKFKCHENVLKHLKYNSVEVTSLYEESFKKAILTFRHQRVYDPVTENIVHLSEPADALGKDLDFLGPALPQDITKGIATGELDPFTKLPIQVCASETLLHGTYNLKSFKPDSDRKKIDLPAQKNLLTNYFCFASIEAKRKFRAPQITPNHSSESNEASSPGIGLHEEKHYIDAGDLKFMKAHTNGQCDGVVGWNEVGPFTKLQSAVCKPCISLGKDLDSARSNGKAASEKKCGIVRSRYFLKNSMEENGKNGKGDLAQNDEMKSENIFSNQAFEPSAALSERTCRMEKGVTSSYFRRRLNQNVNERENVIAQYSIQPPGFDFDAVSNRENDVRSSFIGEISVEEIKDNTASEHLVIKDGPATGLCSYSIQESPSSNNSLEYQATERNAAQTDSQTEDTNDHKWTSGAFSLEKETKDEGQFGCNISHLDRYSAIAEQSIENFVSVISSFRYNSSGSRASGLRAPLKVINNNCTNRSNLDVELSKFVYEPTKDNMHSKRRKTKA